MKLFQVSDKLLLTILFVAVTASAQARQVTISDFLLEVTPPGGGVDQAGYFGLQDDAGAIVRYDIGTGEVNLMPADVVVANAESVPDRIFSDRFQAQSQSQDRSGLYNPLFCFDLSATADPVGIVATDVNGHVIIDEFYLDDDLVTATQRIGVQAPEKGACFYRSYNEVADQYGGFGLFGDAQAASGGLSIEYDVPSSVVQGGTLNYERIITNSSGDSLEVFFQEVFPANPDFFTSASFAGDEPQVRGVVTIPADQSHPPEPVSLSKTVAVENVEPGEYLDLYFAVAALDASGSLIAASEHRRVLVTAADAGQSSVAAVPSAEVVANGDDSAGITVTVRDPQGAPVNGQDVTLDITGGDAGTGGLSATALVTDSNGEAQATLTSTNAESIEVSAYLGASVGAQSFGTAEVGFIPGPAAALAFTSSTADLASGSEKTLTLEVLDATGNRVTGDSGTAIDFDQAGDGSVTGLDPATTASGLASVTVTGNAAGPVTVTASASASGLTPASTEFTVVPGPVAQLVFVSDETDLPSDTEKALTVQLQDAQDNPIDADSGLEVTFAKSEGSGDVSGLGPVTSSGGQATLNVTGTTAGDMQIAASASGVTGDTTAFNVVPGTATRLVFTSNEDPLPIGQTKVLTIEVHDVNGNRVTTDARDINLAKKLNSGTGVVDPMNGVIAIVNGVVDLPVEGIEAGDLALSASVLTGDPNPIASGDTAFTVTSVP